MKKRHTLQGQVIPLPDLLKRQQAVIDALNRVEVGEAHEELKTFQVDKTKTSQPNFWRRLGSWILQHPYRFTFNLMYCEFLILFYAYIINILLKMNS